MTQEDHSTRHRMLHEHLDELIGDYISSTHKLLKNVTVLELLDWSHSQTLDFSERAVSDIKPCPSCFRMVHPVNNHCPHCKKEL